MPRVWMKGKELPYVIGKRKIMVTISHDGLEFWQKGKREHISVPWEKVMPWRGIYVGAEGDESLDTFSAGVGMNVDDRCTGRRR